MLVSFCFTLVSSWMFADGVIPPPMTFVRARADRGLQATWRIRGDFVEHAG
jgi:hypothetical protein